MEKNTELTKIILRAGAKADAYNDILGKCPIHVAIELKSKNLVKVLLGSEPHNKANVDAMDQSGRTALHLAAEEGNLDLVQSILVHDPQVDQEDGLGRRTPLYIAAVRKHPEVVKILLEHGASPLNTCYGKSIEETIQENLPYFDISKVEVIKKSRRNSIQEFGYALNRLLDKGQMNLRKGLKNSQNLVQFKTILARFHASNLDDYSCPPSGMTLLQKASDYGLHEFANLLLDQGANPNKTQECGTAPLLFAGMWPVSSLYLCI